MKLQNLLYATMVACAFSACSNDDDPNIPDPALEMDATLTALFNTVGDGGSALKSKGDGDSQFNNVGRTGIAVFRDTQLLSYQEQDAVGDTTACVAAKSGYVEVLVIANPKPEMFKDKTTLEEFLGTIDNEDIANGGLLMSSRVLSVKLKKGRNVIAKNASDVNNTTEDQLISNEGENVLLYRNVARVEVPVISLNPREGFGKGTFARIKLISIFVANVRTNVRVGGLIQSDDYLLPAHLPWCSVANHTTGNLSGTFEPQSSNYIKKYLQYKFLSSRDFDLPLTDPDDQVQLFVYDNASGQPIKALKNDNEATLLVIKGDYEYETPTGIKVNVKNSYWTVPINNVDLTATTGKDFPKHCGVLRNVKYVISPTITGPGSSDVNPESTGASLTVKFEVVNWGEVELHPEID